MAKQIATMLLKGSRELDRMQEEINQIIEILIGYLNSGGLVDEFEKDNKLRFPVNEAEGMAEWRVFRDYEGKLHIELATIYSDGTEFVVIYHSKTCQYLTPRRVKRVRKALECLAEALGDRYPEMKEEWGPLLEAAEE